mmetsp:Transcript_12845/g.15671  ORF Transcript_12845/g.15671 Transcript_12845/m.15671 type:complete len:222 (+) Transcript_12845:470-1135(+)
MDSSSGCDCWSLWLSLDLVRCRDALLPCVRRWCACACCGDGCGCVACGGCSPSKEPEGLTNADRALVAKSAGGGRRLLVGSTLSKPPTPTSTSPNRTELSKSSVVCVSRCNSVTVELTLVESGCGGDTGCRDGGSYCGGLRSSESLEEGLPILRPLPPIPPTFHIRRFHLELVAVVFWVRADVTDSSSVVRLPVNPVVLFSVFLARRSFRRSFLSLYSAVP